MYKKKFFLLNKITFNLTKFLVLKKKINYLIFEIYGLSFFDFIYIKSFFFKINIYFYSKNMFFWFFIDLKNFYLFNNFISLVLYLKNIIFISKLSLKKYMKRLYLNTESFKIKLITILFYTNYFLSYEYFLKLNKFLIKFEQDNFSIFFFKKLIYNYFFYANLKSNF